MWGGGYGVVEGLMFVFRWSSVKDWAILAVLRSEMSGIQKDYWR
jgi:hypothetical protein